MANVERVAVTLSAELLEEVDRLERNRSRFIAEAVQHELDHLRSSDKRRIRRIFGQVSATELAGINQGLDSKT